jgi:hypothetical protein
LNSEIYSEPGGFAQQNCEPGQDLSREIRLFEEFQGAGPVGLARIPLGASIGRFRISIVLKLF